MLLQYLVAVVFVEREAGNVEVYSTFHLRTIIVEIAEKMWQKDGSPVTVLSDIEGRDNVFIDSLARRYLANTSVSEV